ncbi:MAG: DUF4097 family beta strand repeat protein [Clostridia bacterium]|nr:DUF4097 family beta strand repeat protein [Clostridia bacterium]
MMKIKYVLLILVTILVFSLIATYAIIAAANGFEFWHTMNFSQMNENRLISQGYEKKTFDVSYTNETGSIIELTIDSSSTDVEVEFNDSSEFKVFLQGIYYMKDDRKPLDLIESKENDKLSYELVYDENRIFSFSSIYDATLIVMIPSTYEKRITIHNSSGNIVFQNDNSSNSNITLITTSGNIKTANMNSKDITLGTSSGNIRIEGSLATETFKGYTTSGNVNINMIDADSVRLSASSGEIDLGEISSREVNIESTSGNIDTASVNGEHLTVETSSGTVDLNNITGYADIRSTSGNINVQYQSEVKKGEISSSSGRIIVEIEENQPFTYAFSTSSGSFDSEFESQLTASDQNYKGEVNGGGEVLTLQTSSGNLKLRKMSR